MLFTRLRASTRGLPMSAATASTSTAMAPTLALIAFPKITIAAATTATVLPLTLRGLSAALSTLSTLVALATLAARATARRALRIILLRYSVS